ncbi:aldehyde dehydrogenase family protein, partial [Vibrio sp. 10N.261.45.A4]
STATAKRINLSLAERDSQPVPFIAETGGQNAMIVDSTALPEQVVRDVVRSAFASAGQRCSALRVLFVQKDIAPRITKLIQGAMKELSVGRPYL